MAEDDPLMTYAQIAERLGISPRTLRNYRVGSGTSVPLPAPDDETILNRPRWRWSSIQRWDSDRRGQDWRRGQKGGH